MISRIFYAPGDWLAKYSDVRTRRAIGSWLFIVWFTFGSVAWAFLLNALWFVGFMSLFALWWTGWAGIGTETPTEPEVVDG